MKIQHILFGSLSMLATVSSGAEETSLADLSARLRQLEGKVNNYEAQYGPLNSSSTSSGAATAGGFDSSFLNPGSGSGISRWFEKTSIGAYGEFTFGIDRSGDDEVDFQRFVIYLNHEFNDRLRFVSELEFEHALIGGDAPGAVELEQAYLEYDLTSDFQVRAGLFLVPVGLINEIHEPPTFFGVERPRVESDIIPTTWRENGIGVTKKFQNGLSFDGTFSTGLDLDSGNGDLRSSRTNGAQADGDSGSFTGRVAYTGIEGLRLTAFGQYNTNISRGDNTDGTLYGATLEYSRGGFGLRALFAKWDIDDISAESGISLDPGASFSDVDEQFGWYVEPSYTWHLSEESKIGVFARYSESEFFESGQRVEENVLSLGVNYWPVDNVVFKADYQVADETGDENAEQFNLGFGFQF